MKSFNPTSYEPVKTIPSMPGFVLELVADRVARAHDEVDHARGHAGVLEGMDEVDPESGAADGRLEDDGVPAMSAAADRPAASAIGKLNGLMTANTPCGRRIERVWTAASPRLGCPDPIL